MPRAPRPNPGLQALNLGKMPGGAAGGLGGIPGTRKPTRGALGGAAPVGARTKMPPAIASAGSRGGVKRKAATTPKRKVKK
jgi:hypothetical protein